MWIWTSTYSPIHNSQFTIHLFTNHQFLQTLIKQTTNWTNNKLNKQQIEQTSNWTNNKLNKQQNE
jgi:hypothetical protein